MHNPALSVIRDLWLLWAAYWLIAAWGVRPARRRESLPSSAGWRMLFILGALLLFFPAGAWGVLGQRIVPRRPAWSVICVALVAVGLGLAVWARRHLGAYWSANVTIKEGHRLIRTGPYRRIRHPIYAGILLGALGTALAIGELRSALALGLIALACGWKMRTEETWLGQEFGAEYEEYRRASGALIPRPRAPTARR